MQFLPSTFGEFAVNADPGQPLNPYDPADAIFTAARMLCADGARGGSTAGIEQAIFAYNHADWYVREVMSWAETYAAQDSGPAVTRPLSPPQLRRLPHDQRIRGPAATAPAAPGHSRTRGQRSGPGRRRRVGAAHGPGRAQPRHQPAVLGPPRPGHRHQGPRPLPDHRQPSLPGLPGLLGGSLQRAREQLLRASESLDGVLAAEGLGAVPDPEESGTLLCRATRNAITAWRQPAGTSAERDTTVERLITAIGFLGTATRNLATYAPRRRTIELHTVAAILGEVTACLSKASQPSQGPVTANEQRADD